MNQMERTRPCVMYTNRWLPVVLENRGGVTEASLRLVITRLITILIVLVTAVCTATFFGVPAEGILGLGGVGGLTFGRGSLNSITPLSYISRRLDSSLFRASSPPVRIGYSMIKQSQIIKASEW